MRKFKTEERLNKIIKVVKSRQPSLNVVIENVHDPHNVSAIFRTCDAVGVPKISLLYHIEDFPKISNVTSSSAVKWVEKERFNKTKECFAKLKKDGYKIYASMLSENAKNMYDIDFTEKVAIVLGNENRGVSEEAAELAHECFYIPMRGMIQSLNVSVAAAVTLYEAQRQRDAKGMYNQSELSEEKLNEVIDEWCDK
ncbi:MAG: RNA methyltransferase [Melioribacteraceae bacterium]|nr:RNA methyltransferase [Melioribacteraceae bacterium]